MIPGGITISDYPDPILSASIYADRCLDAVLLGAILPFWHSVRCNADEEGAYLWSVRYSRGGEHLKVRLHAPPQGSAHLRRELRVWTERCLGELDPTGEEKRRNRLDAPAIDEEDEELQIHPDRKLLWTHYRRSKVTFGPEPWLRDDRYAALFTRSLAAGFELLLETLSPPKTYTVFSDQLRQTTVLKGLISGIGALGLRERTGEYLTYHRDWLLRFFIRDIDKQGELLEHFDHRVRGMASTSAHLRAVATHEWLRTDGEEGSAATVEWRRSIGRLAEYIDDFRGNSADLIDPFTEDPLFPPAFKLFHGLANQTGLAPLNEAFLHHMLLQSTQEEGPSGTSSETTSG